MNDQPLEMVQPSTLRQKAVLHAVQLLRSAIEFVVKANAKVPVCQRVVRLPRQRQNETQHGVVVLCSGTVNGAPYAIL